MKGFYPTSVIQGLSPVMCWGSLWEALIVVSQKWSFFTALDTYERPWLPFIALNPLSAAGGDVPGALRSLSAAAGGGEGARGASFDARLRCEVFFQLGAMFFSNFFGGTPNCPSTPQLLFPMSKTKKQWN